MGTSSSGTRRRSARRDAALAHVAAVHAGLSRTDALARDPVRFARSFPIPADREIAALLSALMAFGRVEIIGQKLGVLFERLGASPSHTLRTLGRDGLHERLDGFRHRTFRGEDIADLLFAASALQSEHGRLYAVLEEGYAKHGTLREALVHFTRALRTIAWNEPAPRSARHLLPDPEGPSACKRLVLLSRWVVRPDDGVDLGLAPGVPASALIIPLDVHVHRVARSLGFTKSPSANWRTAEEVTQALRQLDATDPVRFDFALCHAEIARVRAGTHR